MTIRQICRKQVVTVNPKDTVVKAAQAMRECHVGDVVILSSEERQSKPIGILTDRDIVMLVVAHNIDPNKINVEDVMSKNLVCVGADDGVYDAIQKMKKNGVRRVPVVNERDELVGILSSEDLFSLLAKEMYELTGYSENEHNREKMKLDIISDIHRQAAVYTEIM